MLKICFLYLHVSTLKSSVGIVFTTSPLRFSPRLSLYRMAARKFDTRQNDGGERRSVRWSRGSRAAAHWFSQLHQGPQ